MLKQILHLLFPPKCVLCKRLLTKQETDICHNCRTETSEFRQNKRKIPYIEKWIALWYYKGNVRTSLLRYKFHNRRSYADAYGRFLAMKLLNEFPDDFDILSWVPLSNRRRRKRGFDQVSLLAQAVGKELNIKPIPVLRKKQDTAAQSTMINAAARRANILGAYCVPDPSLIKGKRILLLDDIITTGTTVSECGKMLTIAGAKSISCAAVAASSQDKK